MHLCLIRTFRVSLVVRDPLVSSTDYIFQRNVTNKGPSTKQGPSTKHPVNGLLVIIGARLDCNLAATNRASGQIMQLKSKQCKSLALEASEPGQHNAP